MVFDSPAVRGDLSVKMLRKYKLYLELEINSCTPYYKPDNPGEKNKKTILRVQNENRRPKFGSSIEKIEEYYDVKLLMPVTEQKSS